MPPSVSIKQAMAAPPPVAPAATPAPQLAVPASPPVAPVPPSVKSPKKAVTADALAAAWTDFANQVKPEDVRLFSILSAYIPELNGTAKIIFRINNPLQKEPLMKIQTRLLHYLQDALDSETLEMDIEVVTSEGNEAHRAYTSEEKIAQMGKKNPSLHTFVQQFMLAIE